VTAGSGVVAAVGVPVPAGVAVRVAVRVGVRVLVEEALVAVDVAGVLEGPGEDVAVAGTVGVSRGP
jgi:hypothetical protein